MSTAKMQMRLSSSRHRGSRRARRTMNVPPIAVGVSVLVHAAGIGVLVLLRPAPYPPAALETIEIALVTERAHGKAAANDGSGSAIKSDGPAGVSPAALAPSTPVTALPPQRSVGASRSLGAGTTHAFDLPSLPGPQLPPQATVPDALGAAADCPTVSRSTRTTARQAPCLSAQPDDPLGYAPTMTWLPVNAPQPSKVGRENDDWTFTRSPSVLGQSILLPDAAPPANRALRSWVVGLFR
jgi:hypothetical protein